MIRMVSPSSASVTVSPKSATSAIGQVPADADATARGSPAVAAAKAFASEVPVGAGSELFALCGTSATDEPWDLHRHWRNSRTHSAHDPPLDRQLAALLWY